MVDNPWTDEAEYLSYLEGERRMYAWCLLRHGDVEADAAQQEALAAYPYEPPGPRRGLAFHDLAWHWAMLRIHGGQYWQKDPSLSRPPAEYWEQVKQCGEPSSSGDTADR